MIIDDIADLITELTETRSKREVAKHFNRKRKWIYAVMCGCNVVLSPEFIAGLNHYGYELKLVNKGEEIDE